MDYMQRETEKEFVKLKKRIEKEFKKASIEVQEKLDKHLKAYDRKIVQKQKLVAEGKMTAAEFKQWKLGQIAIGKRWQGLKDDLSQTLLNANLNAEKIIKDSFLDTYAKNLSYGLYEVSEAIKTVDVNYSFTIYNKDAVARLIKHTPQILPEAGVLMQRKLAEGKVKRWAEGQIQSVMTQHILQGKSIAATAKEIRKMGDSVILEEIRNQDKKTATQIAKELERRNKAAAVRNARTMTTSAMNGGRLDGYRKAAEMGIDVEKRWDAIHDNRTRDSHRGIDGEIVEYDDTFSNGLMYPGDMSGPPEEVYNCRCAMWSNIKGYPIPRETYREWEKRTGGGS